MNSPYTDLEFVLQGKRIANQLEHESRSYSPFVTWIRGAVAKLQSQLPPKDLIEAIAADSEDVLKRLASK